MAGILRRGNTREAVTIVIHNAVIATVDDRDTLHYGAAIAIDGGDHDVMDDDGHGFPRGCCL